MSSTDNAKDKAADLVDDAKDKAADVADAVTDKTEDLTAKAKDATGEARRSAQNVADDISDDLSEGHGVINRLSRLGLKSEYAYIASFGSIALSLGSWVISRNKKGDDKGQSDRWGIFVGHWAPTFMALGVALKLEEKKR